MLTFSIDEQGSTQMYENQLAQLEIASPTVNKYHPFSSKISFEDIEYDPMHRLGKKGGKVRTAGNSPTMSPSKLSICSLES